MEKKELKEILTELGNIYPVRYARRSAIAPVLWICGATFTTVLIWCTVNVFLLGNCEYVEKVFNFAATIAAISFGVALLTVVLCLILDTKRLHSEQYLIEKQRLDLKEDGDSIDDKDKDDGSDIGNTDRDGKPNKNGGRNGSRN